MVPICAPNNWAMSKENVDFKQPIFGPYFMYCAPNVRLLPPPLGEVQEQVSQILSAYIARGSLIVAFDVLYIVYLSIKSLLAFFQYYQVFHRVLYGSIDVTQCQNSLGICKAFKHYRDSQVRGSLLRVRKLQFNQP